MTKNLFWFLGVAISGCFGVSAQVPHLGSASDLVWSKKEELNIGREAYNRLYSYGDIYDYPLDVDYINYLGNKVASHTETRVGLTFYITNSLSINAFATPGGYIGVNAGLVIATGNEHELAGVLAHEVAHVSQEHIARSVQSEQDRSYLNTAAILASVLVAAKGNGELGTAALSVATAGAIQGQINDIRSHEIEADAVGAKLVKKAGFNTLGMQSFFAKLQTPSELHATPSYLLTHPLPQKRQAALATLRKRSSQLRSSDEYYLFRARIRSRLLPSSDVASLIEKEQKSLNVRVRDAAHYLHALQYMRQGNLVAVRKQLQKMRSSMRNNRDVLLLKAKLSMLDGDNAGTEKQYKKLWKRYRGDAAVAYDYALFLGQRKQYQKAERILSKAIKHTRHLSLYQLYGDVLGYLGRRQQQHEVLIKYYRERGYYEQALAQIDIVLRSPDLDWQGRAMFEAQKKSLTRLIDIQKKLE